jgi:thymidylate synthase (FAD)
MTKLSAKLIGYTQPALSFRGSSLEDIVGYCARVSNSSNQENFSTQAKLFEYCKRHKHWSIFQICNIVLEIEGPRDITRQFLRHDSLYVVDGEYCNEPGFDRRFGGIQEFSQRYSDKIEFTDRDIRRQDHNNRQNSIDDFEEDVVAELIFSVEDAQKYSENLYQNLRYNDVAKECARVVLPEGLTMSRLYVNGTVRSWLHYLDVRDDPGVTQHEHVLLAQAIRKEIQPVLPTILGEKNG